MKPQAILNKNRSESIPPRCLKTLALSQDKEGEADIKRERRKRERDKVRERKGQWYWVLTKCWSATKECKREG